MEGEDPYNHVCTVSIKLPDGKATVEGTASGILIDTRQGLILTHASVLYPLLDQCHTDRLSKLLREGSANRRIFTGQADIEVVLPNPDDGLQDTYLTSAKTIHPIKLLSNTVQDARPYVKYQGKLKTIFECKRLGDTLRTLMPGESWQFNEDVVNADTKSEQNELNSKTKMCYNLLPYFVLIKIQNLYLPNNALTIRDSVDNTSGDLVEICATPFGSMSPDVFLNARSRGILSKVVGPRGILLMTDARCVPGSEGGALFYCHKRKRLLTGIVIASLCWKNNEWVGLSLACAISEVLGSLKSHLTFDLDRINRSQYVGGFDSGFISRLIKHVKCVCVGRNWGSGVVIDTKKDLILTCSHVLKGANYSGVSVNDSDSHLSNLCNIIYKTPLKSQFDIAIIQPKNISSWSCDDRELTFGRAAEGEVVYMIGHAIFRGGGDMLPMVCRGIVSKIVRHNNVPIMLQTSCAIHAGASGGGVFNTHGQLIAIVVCNSKDTLSGASYPHINMCIPMETVASVIRHYIKSNNTDILKSLHITNDVVKRIWSIGTEDCTFMSRI